MSRTFFQDCVSRLLMYLNTDVILKTCNDAAFVCPLHPNVCYVYDCVRYARGQWLTPSRFNRIWFHMHLLAFVFVSFQRLLLFFSCHYIDSIRSILFRLHCINCGFIIHIHIHYSNHGVQSKITNAWLKSSLNNHNFAVYFRVFAKMMTGNFRIVFTFQYLYFDVSFKFQTNIKQIL